MSVHYTHRQSYVPPINRPHAPEQWRKRTPAALSLEEAWKVAQPVEAPDVAAQDVRLYAPYDALLIVRAGVLRTVLLSDDRTDHAGLLPCPECADLVDPLRVDTCPWCDAALDRLTDGSISISLGSDAR